MGQSCDSEFADWIFQHGGHGIAELLVRPNNQGETPTFAACGGLKRIRSVTYDSSNSDHYLAKDIEWEAVQIEAQNGDQRTKRIGVVRKMHHRGNGSLAERFGVPK